MRRYNRYFRYTDRVNHTRRIGLAFKRFSRTNIRLSDFHDCSSHSHHQPRPTKTSMKSVKLSNDSFADQRQVHKTTRDVSEIKMTSCKLPPAESQKAFSIPAKSDTLLAAEHTRHTQTLQSRQGPPTRSNYGTCTTSAGHLRQPLRESPSREGSNARLPGTATGTTSSLLHV